MRKASARRVSGVTDDHSKLYISVCIYADVFGRLHQILKIVMRVTSEFRPQSVNHCRRLFTNIILAQRETRLALYFLTVSQRFSEETASCTLEISSRAEKS